MDARIQKIIERWYITEPAFFQIIGTHDLEENSRISCPFRCGKGIIEYNPSIINSLDENKLQSYLKAEIIRILLKHPYERQPDGCKRESMSLGSNLVLADNYDFKDIDLPKPADYNLKSSESYEWYSYRIEELSSSTSQKNNGKKDQSQSEKGNNEEGIKGDNENNDDGQSASSSGTDNDDNGDKGDGQSASSSESENEGEESSSNTIDNDGDKTQDADAPSDNEGSSRTDNTSSDNKQGIADFSSNDSGIQQDLSELWEEDSLMTCTIDATIDDIQENNAWGSLAGNIAERIIANTKAKIDYRKVLSGFRASVLSTKRRLTRMRPNRRTGFDNMGSIRRFDTNILIAVDVSGSIRDETLCHFYSIIRRAFKYGVEKLDVVQFDTQLGEVQSMEKASLKVKKSIDIIGRGGTSFQPIFDFVLLHPEYDGLLIFTDGFANHPIVPKGMKCKVGWVCNSKYSYEMHKAWMRKIGRCCIMEI